jgi:hypothetical protein
MTHATESLSAQLVRLTMELRKVEQRLDYESEPDASQLIDFRHAVDNVRLKAWSVSEVINARYTTEDPNAVLTYLAAERLRRLDQLVKNLCADVDRGALPLQTSGMHSLRDSLSSLQQRIAHSSTQTRQQT